VTHNDSLIVPVRPVSTPSPGPTRGGVRSSVILRDEVMLWYDHNRKLYFEDALSKGSNLALLVRMTATCPTLRVLLRSHLMHKYGDAGLVTPIFTNSIV